MPRTAAQLAALIAEIDAAITFIIERRNQSGGAPTGNQFSRLRLKELEDLRAQYEAQLEAVNETAGPAVIRFAPRDES